MAKSLAHILRVKVARHLLNWLEADEAVKTVQQTKTAADDPTGKIRLELLLVIADQEKQAFAAATRLLSRVVKPFANAARSITSATVPKTRAVAATAVGTGLGLAGGHSVGYGKGQVAGDQAGYARGSQEGGDNYARNLFSELHNLAQRRNNPGSNRLTQIFTPPAAAGTKPAAPAKPAAAPAKPATGVAKPATGVAKQAGLVGALGKGLMRGAGALGRGAVSGAAALGKQTGKAMYAAAPHVGTAATQAIKGTGRAIGTAAHGVAKGQGVLPSMGKGLASAVPHAKQVGSSLVRAAGSHPLNTAAAGAAGVMGAQSAGNALSAAPGNIANGFNSAMDGTQRWAGQQLQNAGNTMQQWGTQMQPGSPAGTGQPDWSAVMSQLQQPPSSQPMPNGMAGAGQGARWIQLLNGQ